MEPRDFTAASLADLERAAAGRESTAMTELGKRALVGRAGAMSSHDGAALLAAAAEAGDAEADAVISVLIGVDAATPADWGLALGYLERAAFRGWQPARDQFVLLSRDRRLNELSASSSAPRDIWRQIKETIDIGALTASNPPRTVFESPHVAVFENFASRAECERMIGRARPRMVTAPIRDSVSGEVRPYDARTNSVVSFDILAADFVLIVLQARIAAATGFARRCLEDASVLNYARGQEFGPHYDFLDLENPVFREEIARGGQRAATFLIYLNEGFEGGETALLELDWRYKGRPGDVLFFRNVDPSGKPDRRTLHAGVAPTSGEKWLLTQLIRVRPPDGVMPRNQSAG